MDRRDLLKVSAASVAVGLTDVARIGSAPARPQWLPRWRGFNLTDLKDGRHGLHYAETDFRWMSEWGFNFARLPVSYWTWSSRDDWMTIRDADLQPIDDAIAFGRHYGVHVNLALHRIPGYCVNGAALEPDRLFDSPRESMQRALRAATHHWRYLARRYRDVPTTALSFDLVNEPPFMVDQSRYVEIVRALVAAIRSVDPDRLIFVDGADLGQTPVSGLTDPRVVQSTRGYLPKMVSHYGATWVPEAEFESEALPAWPMTDRRGVVWDRERLRRQLILKWTPMVDLGVPVHVGEWGCFNQTPHQVCLAWMGDLLALWKQAGWGWSLWNLRGDFGVLDSGRKDVAYESFRGHLLDRKMLVLLMDN
jgi:endoglucanase